MINNKTPWHLFLKCPRNINIKQIWNSSIGFLNERYMFYSLVLIFLLFMIWSSRIKRRERNPFTFENWESSFFQHIFQILYSAYQFTVPFFLLHCCRMSAFDEVEERINFIRSIIVKFWDSCSKKIWLHFFRSNISTRLLQQYSTENLTTRELPFSPWNVNKTKNPGVKRE